MMMLSFFVLERWDKIILYFPGSIVGLQYIEIGSNNYIYIFFDIVSLLVQSSLEKSRKKTKSFGCFY